MYNYNRNLNNNSIENNLKIAHVVLPVPERPITIKLPLVPITSYSSSVNLILKLGIFYSNSTNLAAEEKSAYLFNNSLFT